VVLQDMVDRAGSLPTARSSGCSWKDRDRSSQGSQGSCGSDILDIELQRLHAGERAAGKACHDVDLKTLLELLCQIRPAKTDCIDHFAPSA
jgi:hypothetical protein